MQAKTYLHGSVRLSETHSGRRRDVPVWELRYRLPSGKDSRKVLGKAWLKASRPAAGYMTEAQANVRAQAFLDDHAGSVPDDRRTFGRAVDDFLRVCEVEKGLRGSTLHEYAKIGQRLADRPWRSVSWTPRPLDTFMPDDLVAVRSELLGAGRTPDTLNHYRRVVRGVFGTSPTSPALAWAWVTAKVESEGKLRFYDPDQVAQLVAHAGTEADAAIYTLATQAGPRMSEIRALRVGNVDFEVGLVRFEDGYTTYGGHAGNKGRRVRSVPLSDAVSRALLPFCRGRTEDALVFEHPTKPGEPICHVTTHRHFKSAAKRAGLTAIRFHDLRHSFGTQAIRVFNIYEVQRMMGHRSITTTERYLHYAPDPDAAAKLSALWEPTAPVVAISRAA